MGAAAGLDAASVGPCAQVQAPEPHALNGAILRASTVNALLAEICGPARASGQAVWLR